MTAASGMWTKAGIARPKRSLARTRHASASARGMAQDAGLRYVEGAKNGIGRARAGKSFRYRDARGRPVTDPRVLERIKKLAIPPAWVDVWICPTANAHLLATGRDVRQAGSSIDTIHAGEPFVTSGSSRSRGLRPGPAGAAGANALGPGPGGPSAREGDCRHREAARGRHSYRVGNDEYVRDNQSFCPFTTLRDSHVRVAGDELEFVFRGKSRRKHTIRVRDLPLSRIVSRCQRLPGKRLFQYLDPAGHPRSLRSSDIPNAYLRQSAGPNFSAKDFRTWAGTLFMARALRNFAEGRGGRPRKTDVGRAIERVAQRLGNTPTICRNCYVHPAVVEAYLDGSLLPTLKSRGVEVRRHEAAGLRSQEAGLCALLERHARRSLQRSA